MNLECFLHWKARQMNAQRATWTETISPPPAPKKGELESQGNETKQHSS